MRRGEVPGGRRGGRAVARRRRFLEEATRPEEPTLRLGDVLRKERERMRLSTHGVAERLDLAVEEWEAMESGSSPAETCGPLLAQIAIALEVPTSRLLAESGRFVDTRRGQVGDLIRRHRERREKSIAEMAEALGVSEEEYLSIEAGVSEIEVYGPLLLGFAEAIEQPVFDLFYPLGLPFQELDDYP